jgi:effector-binding domain-containing protein
MKIRFRQGDRMQKTEIENTYAQILEMKTQYAKEIPGKRVAWPRSIKERIERLENAALKPKDISLHTGIPYDTILQWKYQRNYDRKKAFQEVSVRVPAKVPVPIDEKVVTVTVPSVKSISTDFAKICTVTVTTLDGYKIEAPTIEIAVAIVAGLRKAAPCF